MIMSDAPLRVVKPVVVPTQYFLFGTLIAGFLSIFPGVFTFIGSQMIGDPFGRMERGPDPTYGLIAFGLSFVVIMGLLYAKYFLEPQHTTYTVYPDRVEYDEGFFNRQRRTLFLDQVLDVEMTEGVLQQSHRVGTVTLVTQQLFSDGQGRIGNRRISLTNVPQPHEVYELVRSLVLQRKNRESR
jgi:uncharacterized membrane protein YdbT with pleckstrin-like domain